MVLLRVCRQVETPEKIAYLNTDTCQVGSGNAVEKQKEDMLSESLCHILCHRLPKSYTASQPAGKGDQMMPPELRQMNPNFPSERRGVDVQMLSDPTASNRAAPRLLAADISKSSFPIPCQRRNSGASGEHLGAEPRSGNSFSFWI